MRFDTAILRQCWFLAGPTACGKTTTALELAKIVGGEIVSLDSMALYHGMDIGTAKPTLAEQTEVPHHLIDVLEPHEEYSVAEYCEAAETVCRDIVDRGRAPIFAGGTGLYLRAILRGVFEGPAADWELRGQLEEEAARQPTGWLRETLRNIDPVTAERLHENDHRRLIRAIEVYRLTGRALSTQQREEALPPADRPRHVYWLSPPRDWLHKRINRRVVQMVEQGLFAEVGRLMAAERPLSNTARQGLGYKEVIRALDEGWTVEATIEEVQTRTRQFGKRQETWFRNLKECRAVPIDGSETPRELAERLVSNDSGHGKLG